MKQIEWSNSFEEYLRNIPDLDTDGIETLPVYTDLYPTGQEGIEVDVTEELLAELQENLIRYMELAGVEIEKDSAEHTPNDELLQNAIYTCEIDGMTFVSRPNGMSISFDAESLRDANDENDKLLSLLEENKFLSAACRYLAIQNPSISSKTVRNGDGEVDHKIYYLRGGRYRG